MSVESEVRYEPSGPSQSNLLTVSRVSAYQLCPRLHHLQYHEGYRPIETSEDLQFGTLWHQCMASGLLAVMRSQRTHSVGDRAPDYDNDFILAAWDSRPKGMDPYEERRLYASLYVAHTVFRESEWLYKHEILAVEEPFLFPHINPATMGRSPLWLRAGRVDAIVRNSATGRIQVVEHKTTSDDIAPDSVYWTKLVMDAQISQYVLGVESMHPELYVEECVYSVLHKTGMRPLKATPPEARKYTLAKYRQCPECKRKGSAPAPHAVAIDDGVYVNCQEDPEGGVRRVCVDPGGALYANMRDRDESDAEYGTRIGREMLDQRNSYYRLQVVPRTDAQILDSLRNMWAVSQAIREDRKNGWAPKNPRACHQFTTCPFWGVCTGSERLDNPDKFRRLDNVHPELGPNFVPEVEAIRASRINTK